MVNNKLIISRAHYIFYEFVYFNYGTIIIIFTYAIRLSVGKHRVSRIVIST